MCIIKRNIVPGKTIFDKMLSKKRQQFKDLDYSLEHDVHFSFWDDNRRYCVNVYSKAKNMVTTTYYDGYQTRWIYNPETNTLIEEDNNGQWFYKWIFDEDFNIIETQYPYAPYSSIPKPEIIQIIDGEIMLLDKNSNLIKFTVEKCEELTNSKQVI
jgi:hypothetical protein